MWRTLSILPGATKGLKAAAFYPEEGWMRNTVRRALLEFALVADMVVAEHIVRGIRVSLSSDKTTWMCDVLLQQIAMYFRLDGKLQSYPMAIQERAAGDGGEGAGVEEVIAYFIQLQAWMELPVMRRQDIVGASADHAADTTGWMSALERTRRAEYDAYERKALQPYFQQEQQFLAGT
ncbi:hypothetical protein CYMTET_22258 [Cymbomonas tetramitiformis]|uniref:Uncharacterized protein n=1 Tax=Cymbomonas tetramitiformis TaxID=36881 RepID=A0AAE0L243_9CHLO|nr:hypothetical protein CYMTET_22258 [Cymbomonas tetramitiformis]